MEITKELLLYVKGLVEQKEVLQRDLTNTREYGKVSSLRKELLNIKSKIQSTKAKIHERVYAPINMVYYKIDNQGLGTYYKRVFPLTEREIRVMYQLTNDFNPSLNHIEIISIQPINNFPIEVTYEEAKETQSKTKSP